MKVIFPMPQIVGEVPQQLMEAVPVDGSFSELLRPYDPEEHHEAFNHVVACVLGQAGRIIKPAGSISVAHSFTEVAPATSQRSNRWHTDGGLLTISDVLQTEYLVGKVSLRRLANILGNGLITGCETPSYLLGYFDEWSRAELAEVGLGIWCPQPRQIIYHRPDAEPAHRSQTNLAAVAIPRRWMGIGAT